MHFPFQNQGRQIPCGIQQPIAVGIPIISEDIFKRIVAPLKTSVAQEIVEDV